MVDMELENLLVTVLVAVLDLIYVTGDCWNCRQSLFRISCLGEIKFNV